ncbi:MAG: Holliday junction resolvase RuvX [Puniceicoccales bacterium]|jgi:putative Holliday junction resolvase|nr:Holliday junction resolvase RuvX [Puniceicoccales bacterium]
MQSFLGIDYGDRRIGLSYGDELGIAFPIAPAVEPEHAARVARVVAEARRRKATALVVGYPLNMDGTAGPRTVVTDDFIAEIEAFLPGVPVHRVDEGLTSVEAEGTFSSRRRGRTAKERQRHRQTGELDSRAATLILQDFLNARGYGFGGGGG